ncbi:sugar/nucleoside kinase (ribokinase family) [Balneicella halophila]|uniref:Sugar/nucleoside kinase (Ribokinase family) n=1 Tax=Balneicella halophila TaxID=1537566 RepID=A0A7L4US91_BALHA|nr:PfkB family carbohydrate kinase [Balneicella halophila]PVX52281.1 sugar/nucleoside kinase (ribokinase family) [Balneicella halophila]
MTTNYQDKLLLQTVADKLENSNSSKNILVGYDGFIDEIIYVVRKRQDDKTFERIETITEFSERIGKAAGLSANIEFVTQQIKLGGNGPIMANSLINQGHKVSYAGSIGAEGIHPVFQEFANRCEEVVSFEAPGHTDALEFMDGKLMLGKSHHMTGINWSKLIEKYPREKLTELLQKMDLLSFNNWTMLSGMNSIMEGILSIIKEIPKKPIAFIDLADPQKRLDEDIIKALELISEFAETTQMVLSMNKNESMIVASLLGVSTDDVIQRAIKIREKLNISHAVIHPLHGAAVATEDWAGYVIGPYTQKPKLTTGAGDNFNAGFCNALLRGFTPEECLAVGVNTSGYYVRNAHSPNKEQLIDFLRNRE